MSLLEQAKSSLDKSRASSKAIAASSYGIDSIAASLIYIAESLSNQPNNIYSDDVELIVRRLLDNTKEQPINNKEGEE